MQLTLFCGTGVAIAVGPVCCEICCWLFRSLQIHVALLFCEGVSVAPGEEHSEVKRLGYQWFQVFMTQRPHCTCITVETLSPLGFACTAVLFVPVAAGAGGKGMGAHK